MTCEHKEPDSWDIEEWTDDYGNVHTENVKRYGRSWYEDIDLHRFRCTRCGHIGYYSGAARAYHEKGIRSDIPGLS